MSNEYERHKKKPNFRIIYFLYCIIYFLYGISVDVVFWRPITGSPYRFSLSTQNNLPKMEIKIRLSSPTPLLQLEQLNTNKSVSNPGIFFPMNYLTGVGKPTQLHKTRSSIYSEKEKIKVSQIEVSLCFLPIYPAKEKLLSFNHEQAATKDSKIRTCGTACPLKIVSRQ